MHKHNVAMALFESITQLHAKHQLIDTTSLSVPAADCPACTGTLRLYGIGMEELRSYILDPSDRMKDADARSRYREVLYDTAIDSLLAEEYPSLELYRNTLASLRYSPDRAITVPEIAEAIASAPEKETFLPEPETGKCPCITGDFAVPLRYDDDNEWCGLCGRLM